MRRHPLRHRIFRAAALFLLLFTAADLAFAHTWCGEEQSQLSYASQLAIHSDAGAQHAQNDDCFCCSGHVDVTLPFVLIAVAAPTGAARSGHSYVPVAPTYPAFRPPRIA